VDGQAGFFPSIGTLVLYHAVVISQDCSSLSLWEFGANSPRLFCSHSNTRQHQTSSCTVNFDGDMGYFGSRQTGPTRERIPDSVNKDWCLNVKMAGRMWGNETARATMWLLFSNWTFPLPSKRKSEFANKIQFILNIQAQNNSITGKCEGALYSNICKKKLISLKDCVLSQITRLKLHKNHFVT